jgi:DNA excision repair protein ERCC-1
MADEYGDDADFTAAVEAIERVHSSKPASGPLISSGQPTPRITQPKPQALPSRSAPSAILVSPRQKGNPILNNIHALPWEYSDTPADYVLGLTTCALFLSLKYHRLHPEYIYSRIRALQGKYNLRVLLTMVDIDNHEEPLKELSKTSLINNLTIILCWSAKEAARYLELYKSYEHANPSSIKAHQATGYAEQMVEFITIPRSINKADAVSLVSTFGSIRAAVNARPEEVANISGWGEKKVIRWCGSVREGFRLSRAEKRAALGGPEAIPLGRGSIRGISSMDIAEESALALENRASKRTAEESTLYEPGDDEKEALLMAAATEEQDVVNPKHPFKSSEPKPIVPKAKKPRNEDEGLTDAMKAALAKYRNS